jgi:hypothetical protein
VLFFGNCPAWAPDGETCKPLPSPTPPGTSPQQSHEGPEPRGGSLYDTCQTSSPSASELAEGRQAIASLKLTMRTWRPLLARDIDASGGQFDSRSSVPDDVIAASRHMVDRARNARINGEPLPYLPELEAAMVPAIAATDKEWGELQDELAAHQALLSETREAAQAVETELTALRRILAVVIGTNHRDYHRLRAKRITSRSSSEVDDEQLDDASQPDAADAPRAERDALTVSAPPGRHIAHVLELA